MKKIGWIVLAILLLPSILNAKEGEVKIKIQGSTTVNPVISEAAEILRAERGWTIYVDTQGGSSGGISAVGEGFVDIGMISKPISEADRNKYASANFESFKIGIDGLALVVSQPVWDSGIQFLSKKQIQQLYERKILNWKELGGQDSKVVFYNKEPGRGTWEVFSNWAYGSYKNSPLVAHPEVGANEEAKNKVAFHNSAITQLSYAWAENSERIKAIGIQLPTGESVMPTKETIMSGEYPLSRSLFLVTNGKPTGYQKEFIDFILSDRGQELVKKYGYLSVR